MHMYLANQNTICWPGNCVGGSLFITRCQIDIRLLFNTSLSDDLIIDTSKCMINFNIFIFVLSFVGEVICCQIVCICTWVELI